jgi:hypothetical protein
MRQSFMAKKHGRVAHLTAARKQSERERLREERVEK